VKKIKREICGKIKLTRWRKEYENKRKNSIFYLYSMIVL